MVETLERKPDLSVVVVVYNMPREAPRTLHSLSAAYQRHIDPDDYEVIVVDNGSNPPFDPKLIEGLSGNFRLIRIDNAQPSPAHAINRGLAEARGDIIGVMIDGARIATPGLLHFAHDGARLYEKAVVATLGWYLGHDFQGWSMQCGYDQAREDALLESIYWPNDGYRLFEIGAMDESSVDGWFRPISESNALFLRRELWELLGGVDERFDFPGGGLINLDTLSRILEWPDAEVVILLGEATFHQLHGGVNTNAPRDRQRANWALWESQYTSLRGRPYEIVTPKHPPTYLGTLPQPALARMVRAVINPHKGDFEQPLVADNVPFGTYFLDRDQPPLSSEEAEVVRRFHELYYRRWIEQGADTINLSWFGHQLLKCPLDLWIYQELLVRTRPDFIVETGTWCGGSALYFAMLLDNIGHGRVVTVDIEAKPNRPEHSRISYINGSSVDKAVVEQVRGAVGSHRAMVVLDSDHRADHVYDEMIAYSPLVQEGDYLIVEDTNVNGHPAYPDFGPGPMEAVDRFLSESDAFAIDQRCERFLMTLYPRGYLRRCKSGSPTK
jgi:cephalosporin hydroxylase/glycosyltransferase involved in cell wall biosynthesis